MPIPSNEWNIGQIFLREQRSVSPNEYQIIITMGGIDIEKNGERVMRLSPTGFVDYHLSSQELIIKYDKSQNMLYHGEEGYGPHQMRIPIQYFSDDDKNNLCVLMSKVDGWKKDKYAFVYGKPKKAKSEVGNEGIIAKGRGCLKFGNQKKAEEYAKEALEISPTLDCYLLLLDVYKEKKDEVAFKTTCEEALKHIDNAEERAVLNEKIENSPQMRLQKVAKIHMRKNDNRYFTIKEDGTIVRGPNLENEENENLSNNRIGFTDLLRGIVGSILIFTILGVMIEFLAFDHDSFELGLSYGGLFGAIMAICLIIDFIIKRIKDNMGQKENKDSIIRENGTIDRNTPFKVNQMKEKLSSGDN